MEWWWLVLIGLVALGVAIGIWALFIERLAFTVVEEKQPLPVLAEGAPPVRVLHISDLHLAPWQRKKQRWLRALPQSLQFDLVVNTGDNLGHTDAVPPTLHALAPLLKFPGVFVNGSNDYYAPKFRNPFEYLDAPSERKSQVPLDTKTMTDAFEAAGWLNLNNRGGMLQVAGSTLRFAGVDDYHDGLADLQSLAASAGIGAESETSQGAPLMGVSHAPYLAVIDAMNDIGAAVLFAGHTHGGQVCLPGYGALVTNCDLPTKAAKGLSSWSRGGRQLWLNVCAGLGHSIYAPVRLACRPEVRVVTLVAKNS